MTTTDYILGYGSLLSQYSRQTYSGLTETIIPVVASGWKRSWTVRYPDEGATYLGVRSALNENLEAALVPAQVTPEIRHRERGYEFIELDPDTLQINSQSAMRLPDAKFWIVVNQNPMKAEANCPIVQSYVDTCLIGCLETGGADMMHHFIQTTELWDGHWINDRDWTTKLYPRHTPISAEQIRQIDTALKVEGLLGFRTEN